MEFHTLSRRELQALCKKNKIPANITNAAMVEALKALDIVEGIEELMQPSQSDTVQSSIESLEGLEVTSPYVPPTAGRSTRRRNVSKQDLEPVTATRRTTRKTASKGSHESQVITIETPALVSQSSRRKGQMASACRKMDSQLKECVEEEEKMDVSMTPAPLSVTAGRRRKVEAVTVQKVYSTRRSVRLAEKNMEMLNDEKSEEPDLFNSELLSKDGDDKEVNLKYGNELLGVTGIDATAVMVNYENKEKSKVVSAEDVDMIQDEESCIKVSAEAQPVNEEISDNIEFPGGEDSEVKQSEDMIADEDDAEYRVNDEQKLQDDKEIGAEDVQDFDVTLLKLSEMRLKQEDAGAVCLPRKVANDVEEADSDFINHLAIPVLEKTEPDETRTVGFQLEESEKAAYNAVTCEKNSPTKQQLSAVEEVPLEVGVVSAEPDETVTLELQLEEGEKAADEKQASEAAYNAVTSEHNSPTKQLSAVEEVPLEAGVILAEQIPTPQVEPNKYSSMILSDYEENISSGDKLVIMKEGVKPDKDSGENLNELSLRKLSKMFKEKLEITKKSSNEALPRAALQALPENQAKN